VKGTDDAFHEQGGIDMKGLIHLGAGILVTVMLAGCGSDTTSESPSDKNNAAGATESGDPLEGTWHTEITCGQMVGALDQAGVQKSVPGIVRDEFGLDKRPGEKDPCAGVDGTADHTLRFEGGQFALFSGDEVGWETSYELIDENTFVTGPSEGGSIFTFDFRVDGNKLQTDIVKPLKAAPYIAAWESAPWERES
jgi:hypothetical protein